MEAEEAGRGVGGVQGEHTGALALNAPVCVLQERSTTAPQKPLVQVKFHCPGTPEGEAVDRELRGGEQGTGDVLPLTQYVPALHGLAVPEED